MANHLSARSPGATSTTYYKSHPSHYWEVRGGPSIPPATGQALAGWTEEMEASMTDPSIVAAHRVLLGVAL